MIVFFLTIVAIALMAMGNRLRGGLWNSSFPWGDTISRLLWWGGSTAIASLILGAPWYAALLLIPAQWATASIPLFNSISLGFPPTGGSFVTDFALLTLRGFLGTLGIAAVLFGVNYFTGTAFLWWAVLLIGSFEAVGYLLGYTVLSPLAGWKPSQDFDNGFTQPTEFGELIYGGLLAVGLAVGLLV